MWVFLEPVILLIVEEVCVGQRQRARERERERASEREREGEKWGRQGTFEAGRHLIRRGPYKTNRDRRARSASTLPVVARSRSIYTPPCLPLLPSNILFATSFTAYAWIHTSPSPSPPPPPIPSSSLVWVCLPAASRRPSSVVRFPFEFWVHPDTETRTHTDTHVRHANTMSLIFLTRGHTSRVTRKMSKNYFTIDAALFVVNSLSTTTNEPDAEPPWPIPPPPTLSKASKLSFKSVVFLPPILP